MRVIMMLNNKKHLMIPYHITVTEVAHLEFAIPIYYGVFRTAGRKHRKAGILSRLLDRDRAHVVDEPA
jgi:hypothetical protein